MVSEAEYALKHLMKVVYRITCSPDAPSIEFPKESYSAALKHFQEGSIAAMLPVDGAFRGKVNRHGGWNQFYRVAPGAFAVSEEAWERCMALYYLLEYGNTEIPWIITDDCDLRLINPLQILPELDDSSILQANKIFRIAGYGPSIFCLSGTSVPGDEFKRIYDKYGFVGLVFEEIWRDAAV